MLILGIETSCDETAAALVEDGTKILSNIVASSQDIHAKYGGIIPDRAAREQLKSIIPVIEEALSPLTSNPYTLTPKIDAIAVTVGPGLIGSLLIGVETAKTLSLAWNKPLIPVNHLIGHIYANWITDTNSQIQNTIYQIPGLPAVVLIVSGGHTELVLMKDHDKFTWLGGTRDDAAGECFDKCARLLNLGYPGGPAIETAASQFKIENLKFKITLPRPLLHNKSFDFSFSGLKTAVANEVKKSSNLLTSLPANLLAYELQEAVSDVLIAKTLLAAEKHQAKSILLAGGVAANKRLREKLSLQAQIPRNGEFLPEKAQSSKLKAKIHIPPINLCTDNAAYIASAAFFNYNPVSWDKIDVDPTLNIG